jgi:hypothetical protein
MPMTLQAVYEAVMELSAEDRALLKLRLSDDVPTLHPAWGPELRRRADEMDRGAANTISLEEFREQFRMRMQSQDVEHAPT